MLPTTSPKHAQQQISQFPIKRLQLTKSRLYYNLLKFIDILPVIVCKPILIWLNNVLVTLMGHEPFGKLKLLVAIDNTLHTNHLCKI